MLNKIHQTFWKNYSSLNDDSYKEDFKYNIIYFTECLGCCHNIEKFEDKNLGDAIDIKMFESVNWMIQNEEEKETHKIKRYIMPSNIFKITEKSFFNNLSKNLNENINKEEEEKTEYFDKNNYNENTNNTHSNNKKKKIE